MKKVLMSIHPKWCEKIFNGNKTIEVRKTAPKIDTPFEVLVYETKGATDTPWVDEDGHFIYKGRGQVIGSFVCDGVEECVPDYDPYTETFFNYYFESGNDCLTAKEIRTYGKGDSLYGLHITKPKLFDKPKELSEYWLYNDELHKRWEEDNNFCCYNSTNEYGELINECSLFNTDIKRCYSCWQEWSGWCRKLTRPPSWCYVEDV